MSQRVRMSSSSSSQENKVNILIGVTGSVAAIKLPILIDKLKLLSTQMCIPIDLQVVTTESATHFYSVDEVSESVKLLRDSDEWSMWSKIGDPVLHIELRRWADLMVIAPLDANTGAKMAHGMCDNLLTCIVRAWDVKKPLLYAPAMNTHMWEHPSTKQCLSMLNTFGYIQIPTVSKKLACGDVGDGAMAEVQTIVDLVKDNILKIVDQK